MSKTIASSVLYSDSVIDREDDDDRETIEGEDAPDFDVWASHLRRKAVPHERR